VYLDILKDRLYTFRADSPLRRASQTVLFDIAVALTKLMAPVLSFTAEEIWQTMPEACKKSLKTTSVHLVAFPEAESIWTNADLAQRWDQLLEVRIAVQGELEKQRRDKVIGAPLEARVELEANPDKYELLKRHEQDLSALFIVSQATVERVTNLPHHQDFRVRKVGKASGAKCERCWNYRPAVGTFSDHPTLCDRCLEAIR